MNDWHAIEFHQARYKDLLREAKREHEIREMKREMAERQGRPSMADTVRCRLAYFRSLLLSRPKPRQPLPCG